MKEVLITLGAMQGVGVVLMLSMIWRRRDRCKDGLEG
ncbi:hypothetical protein J2W36_004735 [Variovorax ginsengisoli]|uniref:Uncharacterized protein n=1 Tax=Variovorax ginsengisoli TaxID=363844 RepID=A0ABT9SDM0_9BURK|nr:hypothetical protein [Variovorax ginsengisoli]